MAGQMLEGGTQLTFGHSAIGDWCTSVALLTSPSWFRAMISLFAMMSRQALDMLRGSLPRTSGEVRMAKVEN